MVWNAGFLLEPVPRTRVKKSEPLWATKEGTAVKPCGKRKICLFGSLVPNLTLKTYINTNRYKYIGNKYIYRLYRKFRHFWNLGTFSDEKGWMGGMAEKGE